MSKSTEQDVDFDIADARRESLRRVGGAAPLVGHAAQLELRPSNCLRGTRGQRAHLGGPYQRDHRPTITAILMPIIGLLFVVWWIMVAVRLFQLGKGISERGAKSGGGQPCDNLPVRGAAVF